MRAALAAVVAFVALVSSAGASELGSSSGPTFGRARAYATGGAAALAVGDLTGDDKPDLVTVNGRETVAVLINKGNGSFRAKRDFATGADPRSWRSEI